MTQKPAFQDRNALAFIAALAVTATLAGCGEPASSDDTADQKVAVESEPSQPAPRATTAPAITQVVEKERTITAPFGSVQIAQVSIENAAHAEAGRLHITYFDKDGEQSADYPKAVVMGSWGRMGEWSTEQKYSEFPVIVAEGGGTWQGYTCGWTSWTELQPSGPVELLRLQTFYSNDGTGREPEEFEATIGSPAPDGSFVVSFAGTKERSTKYRREGDAYIAVSGEELDAC
ncbi:hypothetical protein [uncultured Erythrobacter sp.]|uniref:hypothetical protein n=1 Tax=uncultured Erythrobacter sp. TaxID=263913 RepID=UPI002606120E|nr:hypothetical protein [uncultured Erythrobacter sp.]